MRDLTEQGTIFGLFLAADGSRGWMVLQGDLVRFMAGREDIEAGVHST